MNKINTYRLWCILVMSLMTSVLSAQFVCYNSISVSLDPNGEYTLFPEDILADGDLTGLDATVTPSFFNCDDQGPNDVLLEIYDGGNLIFSCISNVNVEDQIDPIAICNSNLVFSLDANGVYVFDVDDIDDGSWDGCGIAQYEISPSQIQCGDPNPIAVTLTVTDDAGNTASCTTQVDWTDYPDPTPNLACNADVSLFLVEAEELEITADMILEGGPYVCPDQYLVELTVDMIERPEPIVTLADTNKMIVVTITNPSGDNSCWGELHVYPDGSCGEPFVVCDTECRSTPFGDCASGHTADDNVEWPCDINLDFDCDISMVYPTPTYLLNNNLAEIEDIFPEIINPECFITGMNYQDIVILLPNGKRVDRKWTVIDWQTGNTSTYTQTINISSPGLMICDTLPWNTPAGDCTSGHTFDDAVEWPADITVSTVFVSPEDLAQNPDVASENVEPQLIDSCGGALVNYADVYFQIDDTTALIERTWGVFEVSTGMIWNYIQNITVHNISGASVVCVTREDGEPIPGVILAPGIETDETGCYSFSNPSGVIVTPVKDSPIQDGVNLLDKILMAEGVLGIEVLSTYQNYAADLSQNSVVSTLDIVLLDKLINGTLVPAFDDNWMFYDQVTQAHSRDISNPLHPYHFIGVKMGDLDNSFPLAAAPDYNPIGLRSNDEILNKKEHYQIPFELNENVRVLGFSLTLENEGPANILNFTNILAPDLPGFNVDDHVVFSPDAVTINYIVPDNYIEYGIALPAGSTLFTLELSPSINTFLSKELVLGSNQDNLLRSTRNSTGLEFTLDWENLIISSVIGVDAGHTLEFFPNPVTDEIQFKGIPSDQQGVVSVIDQMGRVLYQNSLTNKADLSDLTPGMYFLQLRLDNGQVYSAPLSKM